MTQPEHVDNPATPDVDAVGDPDALDTGDLLEVPPEERTDTDDDPANEDAGEDLSGLPEGDVVDVTADPEDGDPDGDPLADEPEAE